jgi:hypothetical protein
MSTRFSWIGIVLAFSMFACGGDDKSSSSSSSGGSSSGGSSSGGSSSGATTSGGTPDGGGVTPKAEGPKLTSVMKMTGSLHVSWDLPAECDGVELERKDGDAEYAVKYTLPGTVDNKHDGTATANMIYSYRARCKVGTEYTAYSNEMSKNPTL